jgi:general secretion pathway protein G
MRRIDVVILDYQSPRRIKGRPRGWDWLLYIGVGICFFIALIALVRPQPAHSIPGKAQNSVAKIDMAEIQGALEAFRGDTRRYPTQSEGLGALVEAPSGSLPGWRGPYLRKRQTINPWGTPYGYISRQPGRSGGWVTLSESIE